MQGRARGRRAIFVDAGAFVARAFPGDEHHAEAAKAWDLIERAGAAIFTTGYVVAEAVTFMQRAVTRAHGASSGRRFAADSARFILGSRRTTVLRVSLEDEIRAVDELAGFPDPKVGYVDCLSFAVMRRERIREAFSFDEHFRAAGFDVTP